MEKTRSMNKVEKNFKHLSQKREHTRNLIFFDLLLTAVVISIIVAGVIELNPMDSFLETPGMTINLVNDAIKLYDDIGTKAFPRIDVDPEFHGMELYVYVIRESDEIIVAHGKNRSLIGKNLEEITEIDGQNVGEMIKNLATEDGKWIEYISKDPVNQKFLPESVWIKKHDGYIFGSGIFHPEE